MSFDVKDEYDKIFRYCYFKTHNQQLAEDLTQETFLKYFSQTSYIERGKPLAYLYTIAKNLCIDTYKKPKTEILKEDISSKDEISIIEKNLSLKQAMEQLPKDLSEIVLLKVVNELSMIEISAITNLSRFAIYRKLNQAFKILKKTLNEEDFLE